MAEENQNSKESQRNKLTILAIVMFSFTAIGILIIVLGRTGIVSVPAAILMLVALVGIYFGFGILIAAHLMVKKLE